MFSLDFCPHTPTNIPLCIGWGSEWWALQDCARIWQTPQWLPCCPPLGISFVGVAMGTSATSHPQARPKSCPIFVPLQGSGWNLLLLVSPLTCSACCMQPVGVSVGHACDARGLSASQALIHDTAALMLPEV